MKIFGLLNIKAKSHKYNRVVKDRIRRMDLLYSEQDRNIGAT